MFKSRTVFAKAVCVIMAFILLLSSCSSTPASTKGSQAESAGFFGRLFGGKSEPHMTNVLFDPGTLTEPFDFDKHHYSVDVPTEYDHINIIPVLDPGLKVEIDNPGKLEYGKNVAKIRVFNDDIESTYSFIINRLASDDAGLNSLSIDGFTMDKPFDKAVYDYSVEVDSGTTSLNISYELSDNTASCEIQGADNIEYGENIVTITVTSQNKEENSVYRIAVKRPDNRPQYADMIKNGEGKFIAITFDDGPSPYTDELLDILKKHDIHATFYLVGNRIESYPDEVKRMANEGHAFGNHTWDHSYLKKLSDDKKTTLLEKTDNVLYELTGKKTTTIRPPGGRWDRSIKTFDNKRVVFWSVDPEDWKYRDTDTVVSNIMNYTSEDSIILLHDLYKTSVKAADIVIGRLKDKGYTFVTVDELLQIKEYKAQLKEQAGQDTAA